MKDQQIEKRLKEYFEKEAQRFSVVQKERKKPFLAKRLLLAAACLALIAGTLTIGLLPQKDTPYIDHSSPAGSSLPDESEQSTESRPGEESSAIDPFPTETEAPWISGTLSLTSVSYKSGSSALRMTAAMKPLSQSNTVAENISISLKDGTDISGCVDGKYLAIEPTEGAHMDCRGVYYDIEKDEEFCLACHIRDAIAQDPYYLDVCIRALIEEHLIDFNDILAGIIDYARLYNDLNNETAYATLSAGEKVTYQGLGGARNDYWAEEYTRRMDNFVYPKVLVMEYGQNKDRCLFTIGSSLSKAVWGVYVFELDTGRVLKLDGETVGLEEPINGYMAMTPEDLVSVNLTAASGIYVDPAYTQILVTVPYFLEHLYVDFETMTIIPVYCGQNVLVFDVEQRRYQALLGNQMEIAPSSPTPIHPARQFEEMIYFPVEGNRYSFYIEKRQYLLEGELLRVCRREDGVYLAAMKTEGNYYLYAFEDEAILQENAEFFVWDENARISLADGTKELLREEMLAASAKTADGRYVYLYFGGEDSVVCLDIATGETGTVPLPKEFLQQASNRERFLLFLDSTEEKLLITYN